MEMLKWCNGPFKEDLSEEKGSSSPAAELNSEAMRTQTLAFGIIQHFRKYPDFFSSQQGSTRPLAYSRIILGDIL